VVEYAGRRPGARHQLVTQYVRTGATVRIRIGAADRKTWWRNFLAPRSVRLHLAGQEYDAKAHVVREHGRMSVVAELIVETSSPDLLLGNGVAAVPEEGEVSP
jgi:hypothetical protein